MSHGPESESHHEPAEPDRVPIPDPGENYMVSRKEGDSWITTHQGPNGDFYTIKNASTPEANMTLYNEKKRNAKLKDALANDLYRENSQGTAMRPAPSDQENTFIAALDPGSTDHEYGVSDKFKNKASMSTESLNKIGSNIFISTGRGANSNNEKAAIDERSASIVLSYEARDKAIAEGKSVEEAQAIGTKVYNDQEDFKYTSRVSPGLNVQPEAYPIGAETSGNDNPSGNETDDEDVVEGELIEDDEPETPPTGDLEDIIIEDETPDNNSGAKTEKDASPDSKEKISSKERRELMKQWFKKTGRNAMIAAKTFNGVGFVDMTHSLMHQAGIPEMVQKSIESTTGLPDNFVKEFRAAKRTLELAAKLLMTVWGERQSEARSRKSTRRQEKNRQRSLDQLVVEEHIAKILSGLGKKHPDTILYGLYKTTTDN